VICVPATIGVPVLAVALSGLWPVAAIDRVLVAVHVLAVAVWIGGLVAIFVVARVASRTLDSAARVAFFRGLGRTYGPLGGIALIVALASGALLVDRRPWDGLLSATVAVATGLVLVTVAGVLQARAMTRLRYRALQTSAGDELHARVARGALLADALRGAIVLLTLALFALGMVLVR
jgi:uncharacterized membrane protein